MITIYKNTPTGLALFTEPIEGSWINVVNPNSDEVSRLQQIGFTSDYVTYPLDMDERPRTERENGELFILLRIPYYQGETSDIPYTTIPLGIVITNQHIVTVCKSENGLLSEFSSGRIKDLSTSKRNRFVLRLLLNTAAKYLTYMREISKAVDILEDRLQKSTRNKEVLELLKYQKSLTYFTTALKSNELMMEHLLKMGLFKMYPEDEDLLEDVLTENQQAIEMTLIESNILSSMMDAFASIISNNLNAVMKILASITIVLALPTMAASFFGMNVHLPFEAHPAAFLIILAISFVISLATVYIFYKRDWF